jgi:Tol biopolymer transport system component
MISPIRRHLKQLIRLMLIVLLSTAGQSCSWLGLLLLTTGKYEKFSWSPDGKQIVFRAYEGIYVMNADGSSVRQIDKSNAAKWYTSDAPIWSPNSNQILFSAYPQNTGSGNIYQIYSVNANRSGDSRIITTNGFSPQWSPDGRKIAFQSYKDNWEIYVANSDGSKPMRMTQNSIPDEKPVWSPDGKQILFVAPLELNKTDLYIMSADGSDKPKWIRGGNSPAWSPDGRKIAFIDNVLKVQIMNHDGSGMVPLQRLPTNETPYNSGLHWSPDQSLFVWFIVCRDRTESFDRQFSFALCQLNIQTYNTNSLKQIRQLKFDAVGYPPIWSPDGKKIGFLSSGFIYTLNVDGSELKQLR